MIKWRFTFWWEVYHFSRTTRFLRWNYNDHTEEKAVKYNLNSKTRSKIIDIEFTQAARPYFYILKHRQLPLGIAEVREFYDSLRPFKGKLFFRKCIFWLQKVTAYHASGFRSMSSAYICFWRGINHISGSSRLFCSRIGVGAALQHMWTLRMGSFLFLQLHNLRIGRFHHSLKNCHPPDRNSNGLSPRGSK